MSKPYKKEKKTKRAKEDEKTNNRNRKYLMIAGGAIALVAIAVTAVLLFNPVVR
jgi:hypothetical protein